MRCYPFLDAEIFTIGQLLDVNKNIITYYEVIFKLERTAPPVFLIKHEVELALNGFIKKLHKLKYCPIHTDKLNFFMSQSKGHIGKLYKFAIRWQFLKINHPNFNNYWITVFKWEDCVSDNKIIYEIGKLGINTDTQGP